MAVEKLLDQAGLQILESLQENARVSFCDLAKLTGLSSPAVSERVRRMENAGYIKGYRATVDYEKMGYPIIAFIRISVHPSMLAEADAAVREIPEVVEGHHLTGCDSLLLKVITSSVANLEHIIAKVGTYGSTTTSIVLSSPVTSRTIIPARATKSSKKQK